MHAVRCFVVKSCPISEHRAVAAAAATMLSWRSFLEQASMLNGHV